MSKTSSLYRQIGQRIQTFRHQKGWTQEQLALNANVNRSYMSDIERGTKKASVEILYKVALTLNVPLMELFRE